MCDDSPSSQFVTGFDNGTLEECKYHCFKNKKCQGINFYEDFGYTEDGKPGKSSRCYTCEDPQRNRHEIGSPVYIYRKGRMTTIKWSNKYYLISVASNIRQNDSIFLTIISVCRDDNECMGSRYCEDGICRRNLIK